MSKEEIEINLKQTEEDIIRLNNEFFRWPKDNSNRTLGVPLIPFITNSGITHVGYNCPPFISESYTIVKRLGRRKS